MKVYLMGSLRNPAIPYIGKTLRHHGLEVFDDWFAAGPDADDRWKQYEQTRGRTYREALYGEAAGNVFQFDQHHLNQCAAAVLALPAGKSAHLEMGYILGQGKPGFVLLDGQSSRWDVMYQFANGVYTDLEQLIDVLKNWLFPTKYSTCVCSDGPDHWEKPHD